MIDSVKGETLRMSFSLHGSIELSLLIIFFNVFFHYTVKRHLLLPIEEETYPVLVFLMKGSINC